ncbi:hypothetical protein ISCGN_003295 [Ixodes scapularis]
MAGAPRHAALGSPKEPDLFAAPKFTVPVAAAESPAPRAVPGPVPGPVPGTVLGAVPGPASVPGGPAPVSEGNLGSAVPDMIGISAPELCPASVADAGQSVEPDRLVRPVPEAAVRPLPEPVLRPVPEAEIRPLPEPGPGPVPAVRPLSRPVVVAAPDAVPGSSPESVVAEQLPVSDLAVCPDTRAELLVLPSPETSTPLESSGTSTPSMPPLEDSVEELTTEFHTPPTISEPSTAPLPPATQGRPIRQRRLPLKFKDYILALGDDSFQSDSEYSD